MGYRYGLTTILNYFIVTLEGAARNSRSKLSAGCYFADSEIYNSISIITTEKGQGSLP